MHNTKPSRMDPTFKCLFQEEKKYEKSFSEEGGGKKVEAVKGVF